MRTPYVGRALTRRTQGHRADMIPVGIVLEHLEKLLEVGMQPSMIARAAGVTDELIRLMLAGRQATTRRHYADAILSVDGRPTKHQALVLGVGTRRRLQGLGVTGWSLPLLSERLSMTPSRVAKVRRSEFVTWGVHERVRSVFDSLGPDGGSKIARTYALRAGWRHPFEWNDIDDPFEVPTAVTDSGHADLVAVERLVNGQSVDATRAERVAAYETLRRLGLSDLAIADRIGVEPRTVQRYSAKVRQATAC